MIPSFCENITNLMTFNSIDPFPGRFKKYEIVKNTDLSFFHGQALKNAQFFKFLIPTNYIFFKVFRYT